MRSAEQEVLHNGNGIEIEVCFQNSVYLIYYIKALTVSIN